MRSIPLAAALVLLVTLAPSALSTAATDQARGATKVTRPKFTVQSQEVFAADDVAPYSAHHPEVYAYIDSHLEEHIANLQRWVRQPSVSAQNNGIREMAELVRGDLAGMGFHESVVVPTDGHPGVWGYFDAGAKNSVLIYLMYDVQPVEEAEWTSPPFEARIVNRPAGRVLVGRGAANQKGPQRALLNAMAAIIAVHGTLPVNVMVAADGEEELGSPHYSQIIDRYAERIRTAAGVIFPTSSQDADGALSMSLGVKGILFFEMEMRGGAWGGPKQADIHSSLKAAVDSPTWRLVQALASLTTRDGNTVLVPDFYSDVRPPTREEAGLINAGRKQKRTTDSRRFGVDQWMEGLDAHAAEMELLYQPSMNIDGIWSGYTGPGVKTILPHIATAKIDVRLPPSIDPDRTLARIRAHLDAGGFRDVQLRKLAGYPASQSSVEAPVMKAAIGVFRKWGASPTIRPRIPGSAPYYLFTERLNLPLVNSGLGFAGNAHAPDEFMLVESAAGSKIAGLAEIEKSYVDLLFSLATDSKGTRAQASALSQPRKTR